MVRDVSKFLRNKEAEADPAMAAEWSKLGDLYSKRLWHQLTIELLEFVKNPALQSKGQLLDLYENFVQDFELRYSTLSCNVLLLCKRKEKKLVETTPFGFLLTTHQMKGFNKQSLNM